MQYLTIPGLVVAGGGGDGRAYTSVEVFIPPTEQSCSLPSLPNMRVDHTMNGLLICGGGDIVFNKDCMEFSSGNWTTRNTLRKERTRHASWESGEGLVMIGGPYSPTTTEMVGGDMVFSLEYDTEYVCAIPDMVTDSVVLTGGYPLPIRQVVARYDMLGMVEELPHLIIGRHSHGCGGYTREDGGQVLLVGGGFTGSTVLSSTEVLDVGDPAWVYTTSLPRQLMGVKGVTLGNTIYFTG